MNTRDMQIELERAISAIDPSLKLKEKLDTNTIFHFLNVAQEKYIKIMFSDSEGKTKEGSQIRLDDIRNLISRDSLFDAGSEPVQPIGGGYLIYPNQSYIPVGVTINNNNGIVISLPLDYMFYIKSDSKVSATYTGAASSKWVQNIKFDSNDIGRLLSNNFNRPIFRNPFIVLESSNIIIYKDYYTNIYNLEVTYIRKPKKLVLSINDSTTETNECELAHQTHRDIIELASKIFIEEHRYKLVKKNNKSEE